MALSQTQLKYAQERLENAVNDAQLAIDRKYIVEANPVSSTQLTGMLDDGTIPITFDQMREALFRAAARGFVTLDGKDLTFRSVNIAGVVPDDIANAHWNQRKKLDGHAKAMEELSRVYYRAMDELVLGGGVQALTEALEAIARCAE